MTKTITKVAVLGGGSFGTVLANLVAGNGISCALWMRNKQRAEEVMNRRENAEYFPGFMLEKRLTITSDFDAAIEDADLIIMAVPSSAYDTVCSQLEQRISRNILILSTAKGIRADGFRLMSEVIQEHLPHNPVGVLSGPNLAKEIADNQYTATLVASTSIDVVEASQIALASPTFRVYAGDDPQGAELAGALKNIYAIIAGITGSMQLGQNTVSMLITRSLAEMCRLASELGAEPMTFMGLAGVGDLFVTCTSPLSRNYRVGQALGQGKTLEQAVAEIGQTAEGVATLKTVYDKARELGVRMPLVDGLYKLIYEHVEISEIITSLMTAQQATDVEHKVKGI
jgi:glycerol-3-phosphate dehydrogenase (NAD(P)+)